MTLRLKRMTQGLTQEELAIQLNVTRSAIAMWETGKAMPASANLIKLARVLNCTVDDLLKESEG